MKTNQWKIRGIYAAVFFAILIIEVLIALFVRDSFIRPYGGDVLVTVLLCTAVRIVIPSGIRWFPLGVFLFSVLVEVGQYFDYVSLLGLDNVAFFRILMGTTFSVADLICYGVGCLLFFAGETAIQFLAKRQ
ncbi:MAG: DUF2809 domain-containing protein [Clostridia bacterium]|nr:DUF2809 domain-containing protein [Clostridia bacterium]